MPKMKTLKTNSIQAPQHYSCMYQQKHVHNGWLSNTYHQMSILHYKGSIVISVPLGEELILTTFGWGGTSHQTFHTTVSFQIFVLSSENEILKCNNVTFYLPFAPDVNSSVIPWKIGKIDKCFPAGLGVGNNRVCQGRIW